MFKEFKEFIMRGNVLEFAVAVIMAGAFGAVVTSFTNDIIMPPIGMALGGVEFSDLKYVLQEASMNADGTVAAEEVAIRWGQWIKYIIDFIIIAFILFLVVKGYNNVVKKKEEPAAPAGPSEIDLLTEIRDALKK
jgi:large conductance mechanosensitive channel